MVIEGNFQFNFAVIYLYFIYTLYGGIVHASLRIHLVQREWNRFLVSLIYFVCDVILNIASNRWIRH
jgi:hypothetical protein